MKRFRNVFRSEEGFTLIELLVVIAVLGILAAIGIPRLTGVNNRARLAEAEQTVGSLANAMEMYFVDNNSYNLTNDDPLPLTGGGNNTITEYIDESSLPGDWTFSFYEQFDGSADGGTGSPNGSDFCIVAKGDNNSANEDLGARINESGDLETTTDNGTNWN